MMETNMSTLVKLLLLEIMIDSTMFLQDKSLSMQEKWYLIYYLMMILTIMQSELNYSAMLGLK